jgi:hypothetical protein
MASVVHLDGRRADFVHSDERLRSLAREAMRLWPTAALPGCESPLGLVAQRLKEALALEPACRARYAAAAQQGLGAVLVPWLLPVVTERTGRPNALWPTSADLALEGPTLFGGFRVRVPALAEDRRRSLGSTEVTVETTTELERLGHRYCAPRSTIFAARDDVFRMLRCLQRGLPLTTPNPLA